MLELATALLFLRTLQSRRGAQASSSRAARARAARAASAQQQAAVAASQASYQASVTQPPAQAAITKALLSPLSVVATAMAAPGAVTISRGAGLRAILPSEVAQLGFKASTATSSYHSGTSPGLTPQQQAAYNAIAQEQSLLNSVIARQNAWLAANPRPSPNAQPSDIAAWLNGAGMTPLQAFPEWDWKIVQKGPPPSSSSFPGMPQLSSMFEPGEGIAVVSLGDNDNCTWYVHPSGAWFYHHVWGESLGQLISSIESLVNNALSDIATVTSDVIKVEQIVASFVPGIGQALNEIVTLGEAALDAISGENALQIAIDTTYHGIIGSIPGGEALTPILDPVVSALKSMAGGSSVSSAVLKQAIAQVPDVPNIQGFSPQSIAGAIASWMASKLGLT